MEQVEVRDVWSQCEVCGNSFWPIVLLPEGEWYKYRCPCCGSEWDEGGT